VNNGNLKPFKPGQSGNTKGRPPKLPALDELLAKVLSEPGKGGATAAETILKALVLSACRVHVASAGVVIESWLRKTFAGSKY